jgi:hypothetical protein
MRFILYLNNAWALESRDMLVIIAAVRGALVRDWTTTVRIDRRPVGKFFNAI